MRKVYSTAGLQCTSRKSETDAYSPIDEFVCANTRQVVTPRDSAKVFERNHQQKYECYPVPTLVWNADENARS